MVNNQVVQLAAIEKLEDIFKELAADRFIYCVDDSCLFIIDEVGIVGYPVWQWEEIFKAFCLPVIRANPVDMFCNLLC